jgi:hypothetical protein
MLVVEELEGQKLAQEMERLEQELMEVVMEDIQLQVKKTEQAEQRTPVVEVVEGLQVY